MTMRIVATAIFAIVLAGCNHLRDGHDGMDGAGVASVLRQLEQHRVHQ